MMSEAEFDRTFGTAWHVAGADIKAHLCFAEYPGNPTGNVPVPFIGKHCFDTVGAAMYVACGLTSADWKKLTP